MIKNSLPIGGRITASVLKILCSTSNPYEEIIEDYQDF